MLTGSDASLLFVQPRTLAGERRRFRSCDAAAAAADGVILRNGQQRRYARATVWTGDQIEELRRLLMEKWDPIGVHVVDENMDSSSYWDEYDTYMPPILRNLSEGGDLDWLSDYLARRRTVDMGMPDRPDLDRMAAEAVLAWNPKRRR